MPTEIERKYLVDASLAQALVQRTPTLTGEHLAQGYLSLTPTVRVRVCTPVEGEAYGRITIKGKGTLSRAEYEYPVPAEHAREMLSLCIAQLTKTRYRIEFSGHTWELDRFEGAHAGLWLAEIELESESTSFDLPPWIGREVTHDARFTNASLARAGCVPSHDVLES